MVWKNRNSFMRFFFLGGGGLWFFCMIVFILHFYGNLFFMLMKLCNRNGFLPFKNLDESSNYNSFFEIIFHDLLISTVLKANVLLNQCKNTYWKVKYVNVLFIFHFINLDVSIRKQRGTLELRKCNHALWFLPIN